MPAQEAAASEVGRRVAQGELRAFLFDLDGVITDTAALHAAAWKRLFDAFLAERAAGGRFEPFRLPEDYHAHVDGRPRYEGVSTFLASRGIELPQGAPDDPGDRATVCGLGNNKDALFNAELEEHGVTVFAASLRLVEALRARAVHTACVSSSKNCKPVLERAGLLPLFEAIVDGHDIENGLPGKPAPDSFLRAADEVGVPAAASVVVEDAISGVAAGRAGGFGLVIGLDRGAGHDALLAHGADLVVDELDELLPLPGG